MSNPQALATPAATPWPGARVCACRAIVGLVIFLAGFLAGCDRPLDTLDDGIAVLPPALHEVSGMVAIGPDTIACVQDEVGAVFLVDLRGELPVRALRFGPDGDYEGIAYTGTDYWVLRSDGLLLQLVGNGDALTIESRHRLPKDCEYEGLCFDRKNQRLLALPKGPVSAKKKERRRRRVFAFDLLADRAIEEPVVTLRLDDLIEQAEEQGFDVPTRTTAKGNQRVDLRLRGSELLMVPGTDELLLLFATDHLLLRVDFAGKLLGARMLLAGLLPQPEAMAFLADGRLIIASEGRRGPAVIVVIDNYR